MDESQSGQRSGDSNAWMKPQEIHPGRARTRGPKEEAMKEEEKGKGAKGETRVS